MFNMNFKVDIMLSWTYSFNDDSHILDLDIIQFMKLIILFIMD